LFSTVKRAHLLHNPTAGEKDFSAKELLKLIKKEGFSCTYASVKEEGWDNFDVNCDFLICAGGDGTVRRIAKALMHRKRLEKQFPVAILPHGTANNIATTLGIGGALKDIVQSWHQWELKQFDIGKIYGSGEDQFFLEGFGCGIFPRLMKAMEKVDQKGDDTKEGRIKLARIILHEIVEKYDPVACKIVADGVEYAGKYLMVEVLNTRSIGPNLELGATADPGDGELDIILVPESHQQKFEAFLLNRIRGEEDEFAFTTIKTKKLEISWEGKDVHVDDERLKPDGPVKVVIEVQPGMIEFVI
jgi:diacylglycerol kinase (ATP)